MSLNRTAKGIVLVPSLLLGSAFLAAAVWGGGSSAAAANRPVAIGLGLALVAAGLLAQLLPEDQAAGDTAPNAASPANAEPPGRGRT